MNSNDDTHTYLAMWDSMGLEYLTDVTEHQANRVLDILADREQQRLPLREMVLRAQFNSQRHYEIYSFDSELSIEEIEQMFEDEPQVIVDAIRECGNAIYSNRLKQEIKIK